MLILVVIDKMFQLLYPPAKEDLCYRCQPWNFELNLFIQSAEVGYSHSTVHTQRIILYQLILPNKPILVIHGPYWQNKTQVVIVL